MSEISPVRVTSLLVPFVLLLAASGPRAARAAEYRDPEGRFVITLPDGFQEVPQPFLRARLEELRRSGVNVPAYQAAFDRGAGPRLTYPYALLEVVPVPGAAWTTADLEGALGKMDTENAAREAASGLDRLGLGSLMRDPRITFVRWEPERMAGVYRIQTQARATEVLGTGRIYFYRGGYIAFWLYYLAGTAYADVAEKLTAALTVSPAYRVPTAGFLVRARTPLILGVLLAAAALGGLAVWHVRRRRPTALVALVVGLSLGGCPSVQAAWTVGPGPLRFPPAGYGTVACD